jgi:hypothetical protein
MLFSLKIYLRHFVCVLKIFCLMILKTLLLCGLVSSNGRHAGIMDGKELKVRYPPTYMMLLPCLIKSPVNCFKNCYEDTPLSYIHTYTHTYILVTSDYPLLETYVGLKTKWSGIELLKRNYNGNSSVIIVGVDGKETPGTHATYWSWRCCGYALALQRGVESLAVGEQWGGT